MWNMRIRVSFWQKGKQKEEIKGHLIQVTPNSVTLSENAVHLAG
jgi:hypothetical protein